jgi:hypothetical protein
MAALLSNNSTKELKTIDGRTKAIKQAQKEKQGENS